MAEPEKDKPIQIEYIDTMVEMRMRRQDLMQATELNFYKEKAERMALLIDLMVEALKQGKIVRFQGMTILQKLPDGVQDPRHQ